MVKTRITVVVENTIDSDRLTAEHGLSFWIERGDRRLLFDTGQGEALMRNAEALGAPLHLADDIVLSHGHYDHTGGLPNALKAAARAKVYLHPAAMKTKYSCSGNRSPRENGMPRLSREALERHDRVIPVEKPTEIEEGIYLTGPIPRRNDFEDTGGRFYKDAGCSELDDMVDDLAAYIETFEGTIVILGCAHAGIINTLEHVLKLTDQRPIHTVAGGMHLVNAGPERIEKTVRVLRQLDVRRLFPCHCTGFDAKSRMWAEFPNKLESCSAGTVIDVEG